MVVILGGGGGGTFPVEDIGPALGVKKTPLRWQTNSGEAAKGMKPRSDIIGQYA